MSSGEGGASRKRRGRADAWLTAELDAIDRAVPRGGPKQPKRSLKRLGATVAICASLAGGAVELGAERKTPAAATAATEQNMAPAGRAGRENADRRPGVRLSHDEKEELGVLVGSMLITHDIPAELPFRNRVGEIPDPQLRELVKEIDETLGGRIDWPNMYVTDLSEEGIQGVYRSLPLRGGRTYPADHNADREGLERFGIHIDRAIVNGEMTGCAYGAATKHMIVHELQHAISLDNAKVLADAAERSGDDYEWPKIPTAESRADMAMLVYAEMEQRRAAGGPALNELPPDQRREVVREVLTQYVTPLDSPPQDMADVRLREMLRSDAYHHEPENQVWRDVADLRTTAYVNGLVDYSREQPFVPTGMDPEAREREVRTPLPELAERWGRERPERVDTLGEWRTRYDPQAGPPAKSVSGPTARRLEGVNLDAPWIYEPTCSPDAPNRRTQQTPNPADYGQGEGAVERHRKTAETPAPRAVPDGGPTTDEKAPPAPAAPEAGTGTQFEMTHGADTGLEPGWYVEKHERNGDGVEWIKGPGTTRNVRDELRTQLGAGQDQQVREVVKRGLDEHVTAACRRYLEDKCPERLSALGAATKRVDESQKELQRTEHGNVPARTTGADERARARIGRPGATPAAAPPLAASPAADASRPARDPQRAGRTA